MKRDIEWLKNNLIPSSLGEYKFSFRYFEDGEFGALSEFQFESSGFTGVINFWTLGWLEIFIWDVQKEEIVLNVLLAPGEEKETNAAWEKFDNILQRN